MFVPFTSQCNHVSYLQRKPLAVELGQKVIYGKFDGTELKYNDLPHQLIKDDDVLLKYSSAEPTVASVEPVKDQVMIKLPPKEGTAISGIIITTAESKEKKQTYGVVEKVGPGRPAANGEIIPIQVKPGKHVYCNTPMPRKSSFYCMLNNSY